MNLDLFNNLINSIKENDGIQNFINELNVFLENKESNNERNQTPLLEKIVNGGNLTAQYRDKINTEKVNILRDYAKQTADEGKIYYISNKSSLDNNTYILGVYGEKRQEEVDLKVNESKLPKGAEVNDILRMENGKFVLDKQASEKIDTKMTEMINELKEEQNNMLKSQRIEGHIYEFVEKGENEVWLIDKTNYTGDCIEEFEFPNELLNNAKQGDVFQYINGKYQEC